MQARPAAGACAARLLALLLAFPVCANAYQHSASNDLIHDVMKRSTNDSDSDKSNSDGDDFLGEQVSATEDSISASENENSDELIKAGDMSGEASSSAISDLDAALAVAQDTAGVGVERRSAQSDADTTALDIAEPTLKADSITYDRDNSSSDHDLNSTKAPVPITELQNTSVATQEPEVQRRSSSIYESGYNTINNNLGKHYNPYELQPNVYLNAQAQAEVVRNYGNQAALIQNPDILKQNYDQSLYPTLYQKANPYFTQSLNQNPTWNMQAPALGNPLLTASSGLDPRALFPTQLNPYPSLTSAQATSAITMTNPLSSFPRKLIPKSDLLYLERIPGADDIITCSSEGEMYNLRTPWEQCLVCACVRVRGRVQPACAPCDGCTRVTPFDIEGIKPKLPTPLSQTELETLNSGPAAACAPLPFGTPFEHPLNPCRICVCQKKNILQNEVFVSCKEDPQCVKPLQLPVLPAIQIPNVPVPTPLCDKFPPHVEFPHPTERCQVCTCLRRAASFGIPDLHLLCASEESCIEALRLTTPKSYLPGQGAATSFEPYLGQNKPNVIPFSPIGQQVTNPSDVGPSIQVDSFAFADDSSGPPSPGLIDLQDSLLLSPDKPVFDQIPQTHLGFIPELPQRPAISDFLTVPQTASVPSQFEQELEKLTGSAPTLFPSQLNGLIPKIYPTPKELLQPTELQTLQQEALPWPPITLPALHKPEHGPLLGPPPHQSCRPFPTSTPFQHPWDSCQLCVCAEYPAPAHTSVEVNCYTKPSCCKESPVPSSSFLSGSATLTQQLQILDSMCELKSLSIEFVSPRDACQVCSCEPLAGVVVPLCRSNGDPLCKADSTPAPPSLISYVEPKCRHQSPDKPFVSDCSVCVCHIVFTFIIAKCTLQPKCLQQKEQNSKIIKELQQGITNTGLVNSISGYNQPSITSLSGSQTQNFLPTGFDTSYLNALNQLQGKYYNQYGQKSLSQSLDYRPDLQLNYAQEPSSLLQMYTQNKLKNVDFPGLGQGVNSANALSSYWQSLQSQANAPSTTRPYTLGSAEAYIEAMNSAYQQNSQEPASLLQKYTQNTPSNAGSSGLAQDETLAYQAYWQSLQSRANAPSTVRPQSIASAEAFIEAINSANMQTSQPSSNGYLQSQSGPDFMQSSSLSPPLSEFSFADQQSLEQNLIRNPEVIAQAQAQITAFDNINSKQKTYPPYTWSMDLKQLEAAAAASADASPSTYDPLSNSYSYSPPQMTYYPTLPSGRESSTLAYAQGDSSASGLLSALASAGASGALVTRTGRGPCAYAGDAYHRACQACYCLADAADASAGDAAGAQDVLYSMCLGKPCH